MTGVNPSNEHDSDAIDINVTEEEANQLLASDDEAAETNSHQGSIRIITDKLIDKPSVPETFREIEPINRPLISDADHEDYPIVPMDIIRPTNIINDMCFTFKTNHSNQNSMFKSPPPAPNYESETESLIVKLDKLGVFSGSEHPLPRSNELRNIGQKQVIGSKNKDDANDDDESSDDEIEMIGVVTSDKVKYKVIKIEEQEDVKKRLNFIVHATKMKLTDRIDKFWNDVRLEITRKNPLVPPHFMKGRISNPKYSGLKRTIADNEEESVIEKRTKKACIQVEIQGLPQDWIDEGVSKIESIANAFGINGEKTTKEVRKEQNQTFIVIFQKEEYATKMYNSLNERQIDQNIVKVSKPHPLLY